MIHASKAYEIFKANQKTHKEQLKEISEAIFKAADNGLNTVTVSFCGTIQDIEQTEQVLKANGYIVHYSWFNQSFTIMWPSLSKQAKQ